MVAASVVAETSTQSNDSIVRLTPRPLIQTKNNDDFLSEKTFASDKDKVLYYTGLKFLQIRWSLQ